MMKCWDASIADREVLTREVLGESRDRDADVLHVFHEKAFL